MNHFFDLQTLILKLSGLRSRGKVVDFLFPFGELAEIRIEQFVETLSIVIEICESFVVTIQKFTVSDDTLFIHISEIKAPVLLRNDGHGGTDKYSLEKLKDTRRRISNPSSNLGAVALRVLDDDFKLVSLTDELKATLGIADDDVPSTSFLFADVWSEILQRSFHRKGSYRIFPIGVSKFWSPDDLVNAAKVDQDYSTDQSVKFEVAHQAEPILLIRLGDQIST